MCRPLRQLKRQVIGGADVVALGDMQKPALLNGRFLWVILKPAGMQAGRHRVSCQQVCRQFPELIIRLTGCRAPVLNGADPVPVM